MKGIAKSIWISGAIVLAAIVAFVFFNSYSSNYYSNPNKTYNLYSTQTTGGPNTVVCDLAANNYNYRNYHVLSSYNDKASCSNVCSSMSDGTHNVCVPTPQ